MKERIQKILANAGVASRRNVEEMVQQGRVAVNGRVMTELPILIDPAKDKVTVDDEPVKLGGKGSGRTCFRRIRQMPAIPHSWTSLGRKGSGRSLARISGSTR